MAVRTANQRAYMVGEGEFRKSIGETLVIISRHSTSCPLCKPFEGKVLIDDVYSGGTREDGDYMLLSEAMAQGLYHPRCRHGLGTYYPELEDINGYETKPNDYGETVDKSGENGILKEIKRKVKNDTISTSDKTLSTTVLHTPSGSDLFSDKAKEKLYRDERILTGNRHETTVVYDADGNVVLKKKGNAEKVDFSAEEIKKMKGCVITHNHPSGTIPSPEDIFMLKRSGAVEIRACNCDGSYVIKAPEKWSSNIESLEKLKKEYWNSQNEIGLRYRDIAAQKGKSISYYFTQMEDEGLRDFCNKYGFEFRWDKKK